jgi:hypothetical protein
MGDGAQQNGPDLTAAEAKKEEPERGDGTASQTRS